MGVYINGKFCSAVFKENETNLKIGELKFISTSSSFLLDSGNVAKTDEDNAERGDK